MSMKQVVVHINGLEFKSIPVNAVEASQAYRNIRETYNSPKADVVNVEPTRATVRQERYHAVIKQLDESQQTLKKLREHHEKCMQDSGTHFKEQSIARKGWENECYRLQAENSAMRGALKMKDGYREEADKGRAALQEQFKDYKDTRKYQMSLLDEILATVQDAILKGDTKRADELLFALRKTIAAKPQ